MSSQARTSWLSYPCVYIIKSVGIAGTAAQYAEPIGYFIADFVARALFGVRSGPLPPPEKSLVDLEEAIAIQPRLHVV